MTEILMYKCIHSKLVTKADRNGHISKRDLYMFLGINYKIPRNLITPIIKEMEDLNIIKNIDKQKVIIMPCKFNAERDANKFYKLYNVF